MHCNGEAHNRILKQIAKTLKTYINVKTTNWLFKTDHFCSPENSFPETFSILWLSGRIVISSTTFEQIKSSIVFSTKTLYSVFENIVYMFLLNNQPFMNIINVFHCSIAALNSYQNSQFLHVWFFLQNLSQNTHCSAEHYRKSCLSS